MKVLKITGLALGFLLLMFAGGSQFRPLPAQADSYGVDNHMRSYKSFDGSNLSDNDLKLIARGFDHYDQRHKEAMRRYINDTVQKAIREHEENKHR